MTVRGARALALLWVGALFLPAAAAAAAVASASADTPVVSAHRAAVSGFAENTLAGFAAAAAGGETDVEGDTFVTKDGVLVLSHDSPLRAPRCSGPHLNVALRLLEAAQLSAMTCGGEPIARLDEVIAALQPYPAATLRIEIKHPAGDSGTVRRSDAVLLTRLLADTGMTTRSIVQDFDWATTTPAIRTAAPAQRVSALSNTITAALVNSARSLGAHDFSYAAGNATGFWNRYIAAQGLRSAVWTVNDTFRARALRAGNVGTVISDVPTTLREAYAAPDSGCVLTRYSIAASRSAGVTALREGGGRLYVTAPRKSPDGRVAETVLLKVTARTASGTATVQIGPQGTPYTTTWETSVGVTSTSRSAVVEVALGDAAGVRIRNTSATGVRLTATPIGGTVYTCP